MSNFANNNNMTALFTAIGTKLGKRPPNFIGTLEEWNALSASEKAKYKTVDTPDGDGRSVDNTPTEDSDNLVTSGGVFSELAKKANLTQISNPNLLDNPWFTVNQRGQSSYASAGYTVDRWKLTNGDMTVNVGTDHAIELIHANNNNDVSFINTLPQNVANALRGKTVTLSVLDVDGNIYANTFTLPEEFPSQQTFYGFRRIPESSTEYFYMDFMSNISGATKFAIRIGSHVANATISIRAVKLELGSVSTLGMDTIPNYTSELLKCQEYLQVFVGDLSRAVTVLNNRMQFNVPLIVRLHSTPTVTATPRIFKLDTTEVTGFTFSYSAINNYQTLRINADKTAHGLSDAYINAGTAKMYLSAEL